VTDAVIEAGHQCNERSRYALCYGHFMFYVTGHCQIMREKFAVFCEKSHLVQPTRRTRLTKHVARMRIAPAYATRRALWHKWCPHQQTF
jgi:hypothetical protein